MLTDDQIKEIYHKCLAVPFELTNDDIEELFGDLRDLKQRLSEARTVVEYYSDRNNHILNLVHGNGEIYAAKASEYLKKYEEGK